MSVPHSYSVTNTRKKRKNRLPPSSIFKLDFTHLHTAFIFEAALSSIVVVITLILNDWIVQYFRKRHHDRFSKWKMYLCHIILSFFSILVLLYGSLYLFGYGDSVVAAIF